MESSSNIINIDVHRLQKIGRKVNRLLKKECRDAVEAMYVLKAMLYLLRCAVIKDGIVLDNEAELDAELTDMIDKAVKEGE
jgi:hypothetical protein